MDERLKVIQIVIDEHRMIRDNVKLVDDTVSDSEAVTLLNETHSNLNPQQMDAVDHSHKELQGAINLLDQGLQNHFTVEDKTLPSLLGELLMEALRIEHNDIISLVNEVKAAITNFNLEGLNREEMLYKEFNLQKVINNLTEQIEQHAAKEEAMLNMMKRVIGQ
jgi:hemerythrin